MASDKDTSASSDKARLFDGKFVHVDPAVDVWRWQLFQIDCEHATCF